VSRVFLLETGVFYTSSLAGDNKIDIDKRVVKKHGGRKV
jgi:hypothetical protein